jgi:hypothetical protein
MHRRFWCFLTEMAQSTVNAVLYLLAYRKQDSWRHSKLKEGRDMGEKPTIDVPLFIPNTTMSRGSLARDPFEVTWPLTPLEPLAEVVVPGMTLLIR